jgi:glycosyltransferase involved in cell wall biosynthesis
MRIGMNLFPLNSRGGGMRHYVMQLIPWLLRLSNHDFTFFYRVQALPSLAAVLRRLSAADRSRIRMVELDDQEEIFAYANQFDLYFCPLNGFAPNLLDRPTLGTLADIQDQYLPQYFTEQQLQLRRQLYPFMARAVTTLLTISEFSKRSICEKYEVTPSKVRVTYLAPSDDIVNSKASWPEGLRCLPKRYVFYPANLYPHKNHELLLKSVRHVRDKLGVDCACVMTGHEASPGVAINERIEANGLSGIAHWLGHVPPGALRYLYENALALAFPSRFEGFGMPLVEAMYCDCPVIATRAASIPEVVAGAGLLVESTPEAFGEAIARLFHEPKERQSLIAKGRARASCFTPKIMAEATLAALDEAPAKFVGSRPADAGAGVSYVVRPATGAESLVRSLASISFEAEDSDEVIILAQPGGLSAKSLALCDNFPNLRFISPEPGSAWIDHVQRAAISIVHEGERLCPGAANTAVSILKERSGCEAVLGQAIAVDSRGQYQKAVFVPDQRAARIVDAIPSAAVFWRRSYLVRLRELVDHADWIDRLVSALNGQAAGIERTFTIVETKSEPVQSSPAICPQPVAQVVEAAPGQVPSPGFKTRAWSPLAQNLARFKKVLRKIASMLPASLEIRMRRFYVRRVAPHISPR